MEEQHEQGRVSPHFGLDTPHRNELPSLVKKATETSQVTINSSKIEEKVR